MFRLEEVGLGAANLALLLVEDGNRRLQSDGQRGGADDAVRDVGGELLGVLDLHRDVGHHGAFGLGHAEAHLFAGGHGGEQVRSVIERFLGERLGGRGIEVGQRPVIELALERDIHGVASNPQQKSDRRLRLRQLGFGLGL